MELLLPYGNASMPLSVPDERLAAVLSAAEAAPADGKSILQETLAQDSGHDSLQGFIAPGEPLLVLVNDATRPTPTSLMLESLWPSLSAAEATFLVATGTHRAPTPGELRHIFGNLWDVVRDRVAVHDARDRSGLALAGKTSLGNEIFLNRKVIDAERILILGSVEAHYFAGFTGGRKIILPGVAGFDTIERNHRLAMEDGAEVLRLEGNPVNREMDEALDMLSAKKLFAVLAVLDRSHGIQAVQAGNVKVSFQQAAAHVRRLFSVPVADRADIVVAVATHPLDLDLYQAQKALENGSLALRDGGTLILVSACRDGIGNDAFLSVMDEAGTPDGVLAITSGRYRLGYHKAARLAAMAKKATLRAVVGVGDAAAQTAFMEPHASAQDALDCSLTASRDADVLVLMDAGTTVPVIA